MLYAEGHTAPLTRARPRTSQRTIHVTLLLSLVLHLVLWSILNSTTSQADSSSHISPLAVRLMTLPSPTPAPPSVKTTASVVPRPHLHEPAARPAEQPAQVNTNETRLDLPATAVATATAPTIIMEPPRHDAAYLHNPEPRYPLVARRRQLEGTVVIRVQVGSDGSSLQSQLHQSSGHSILDQVALETVSQWRFVPARRGDESVVAWVEVPITFRLTTQH